MKKLKVIAILLAITTLTNVHAVLQSRDGVAANTSWSIGGMFNNIRKMEQEGGILGLNATFATNTTTKKYEETSAPNNIDPHMCKNTEWGAVAMLSASSYGAGNKIAEAYDKTTLTYGVTASTTGNMSGVFGMRGGASLREWVAGGIMDGSGKGNVLNVADRYVDSYETGTSSKDFSRYIIGDATYEVKSLSTISHLWEFVYTDYPIFQRGDSHSVFSSYPWQSSAIHAGTGSRACIWVGEGI